MWAAKSQDSELAEKIRSAVGIQAPEPIQTALKEEPTPPPVIEPEPMPAEPIPTVPVEPPPPQVITFSEIIKSSHLWPKTVALNHSKKVPIRYQDKIYGHMEFTADSEVEVVALTAPSDIYCIINGNHLSLAHEETNFTEWFAEKYAGRYELQTTDSTASTIEDSTPDINTPEGKAEYTTQVRLWCHLNYDSISLEIGEDALIFKWLPKEETQVNYVFEARQIARQYLLLRAELGGNENYAACEIRDPVTNELLGASSIFIPRL